MKRIAQVCVLIATLSCAGRSPLSEEDDASVSCPPAETTSNEDAAVPASDSTPPARDTSTDTASSLPETMPPVCAPPPPGPCDTFRIPIPKQDAGACAVVVVLELDAAAHPQVVGESIDCVDNGAPGSDDRFVAGLAQAWWTMHAPFVVLDRGIFFHDLDFKPASATLALLDPSTLHVPIFFRLDGEYRWVGDGISVSTPGSPPSTACLPSVFPSDAVAVSWPGDRTFDDATATEIFRAAWYSELGGTWQSHPISTPRVLRLSLPGTSDHAFLVMFSVHAMPEGI